MSLCLAAHLYSRGTWTTPVSANVADRDQPTGAYAVTAMHTVPTYLKWMLLYEEPETRTLWLGKATPRDWLSPGQPAIAAANLTSRYGRISLSMHAASAASAVAPFSVAANVTVPPGFTAAPPAGGLVVRIRAPLGHAGKLSSVTVGGKQWAAFNASEETITFTAAELTPGLAASGLAAIVASFGAAE